MTQGDGFKPSRTALSKEDQDRLESLTGVDVIVRADRMDKPLPALDVPLTPVEELPAASHLRSMIEHREFRAAEGTPQAINAIDLPMPEHPPAGSPAEAMAEHLRDRADHGRGPFPPVPTPDVQVSRQLIQHIEQGRWRAKSIAENGTESATYEYDSLISELQQAIATAEYAKRSAKLSRAGILRALLGRESPIREKMQRRVVFKIGRRHNVGPEEAAETAGQILDALVDESFDEYPEDD